MKTAKGNGNPQQPQPPQEMAASKQLLRGGGHYTRHLRFRFFFLTGVTIFLLLSLLAYPALDVQDMYPLLVKQLTMVTSTSPPSPPPSPSPVNHRKYDVFHYTSLDPSDAVEKEKIKQLLDSAADGGGRRPARFYSGWHDSNNRLESRLARLDVERHLDSYERRPLLRRLRDRWPPDISNPKYAPYLMQFRQLLQNWARKKRYEPQIMNELVSLYKDPIDRHHLSQQQQQGQKYKTCAVVGNSGILLNKTYGELIDSHQMVMRLNNAKVSGFEAWVGSKTTISFVNSNIIRSCSRRLRCSCPTYGEGVPVVSYICQVSHFMDVAYCGAFRKAPLLVTDPRFDSLSTRIIRYYSLKRYFETTGKSYEDWNKLHDGALFHYSSGMQAIMLALGICEKVDVFGFGKVASSSHHYHTNQKTELALHDYEAEYVFYGELAGNRTGSIPFLNESGLLVPPVEVFL